MTHKEIVYESNMELPDEVLKMLAFSQGLLLVTGGTKAGKSSVVSEMIKYLGSINEPVCSLGEFYYSGTRRVVHAGAVGTHEDIMPAINLALGGYLVILEVQAVTARQVVSRILRALPKDADAHKLLTESIVGIVHTNRSEGEPPEVIHAISNRAALVAMVASELH